MAEAVPPYDVLTNTPSWDAVTRRACVVDADRRTWDVPNLWVCDGSLVPTLGGVNPSLTIPALAMRIGTLAARSEL